MRACLLTIIPFLAIIAGEAPLLTTWRGPAYDGVMPAQGLPMHFCWYDQDGPDLAAKVPKPENAGGNNTWERSLYGGILPGGAWPKPGTRTNACWRVPLPAWGASTVVAVGTKAFTTCEAVPGTDCQYTLVCVDIPTGKLDWVKPIDHLLAMPQGEAAKLAALRKAEVEGWAETMRLWNRIYWDNDQDTWFGTNWCDAWSDRLKGGRPGELSAERKALEAKAKADGYTDMSPDGYHRKTGRYGHAGRETAYKAALESRAYVHCHNKDWPWYGSTCSSPVGDGAAVYAVVSPDAAVCYELDGKLRWAADMQVGPRPGGFFKDVHRHMASPVIADGKLIYFNNTGLCVFAWDCATGRLAWKSELPLVVTPKIARDWWVPKVPQNYGGHMGPGGTPVVMPLKDAKSGQMVNVVIIANGDVFRVADGRHLGWFNANGDVVYATAAWHGDVYLGKHGIAHRLGLEGDTLVAKEIWNRSEKGVDGTDSAGNRADCHKTYLSLTTVPGKGFITTAGLWDAATGKTLQDRISALPGHGYVAGCLSRDGLYVHRSKAIGNETVTYGMARLDGGATGIGLIVEGKHPDEVRQAAIDRFGMSRIHPGWCHPTAHGNRILIRTNAYMYCFGEGAWQPAR